MKLPTVKIELIVDVQLAGDMQLTTDELVSLMQHPDFQEIMASRMHDAMIDLMYERSVEKTIDTVGTTVTVSGVKS